LRGDVQRARRFVGQEQRRLCCDRNSDDDALALAARELMRIVAKSNAGVLDSHPFEEFDASVPSGTPVQPPGTQRFVNLFADRHGGIERASGILEHHAHPARAHAMDSRRAATQQVLTA
jgi:hypothetical protein